MMGIPLREERHLAAQCLYFVNLSTGTQGATGVAGALWGRELGEWWETEPRDPRRAWDYNAGVGIRVRINDRSRIRERSELVIVWAISDPENQRFEICTFEINMGVDMLLM